MSAAAFAGFFRTRRGRLAAAAGVTACVAAGAAIGLYVAGQGTPKAVAYANVSRNTRVCLMAEATDTVDAQTTAATWAGLQKAASSGHANAERLILAGTTPAATAPYFNGAVQQHCALIVAVGGDVAAAVDSAASSDARQQFLLVGAASTRPNVRTIPSGTASMVTNSAYPLVMQSAG